MCNSRVLAAAMAACMAISISTVWAGGGPPPPHGEAMTGAGKSLVDGRGMTLYVFDRDGRYRPTCADECATTWKPFSWSSYDEAHRAKDSAAHAKQAYGGYWIIIGRGDGIDQWAYGGRPLYHYSGDLHPGDVNGDGAEGGAWHVARVLCLPLDERGQPDETGAIAVVDAANEMGTSPLQELRRWCGINQVDLAQRTGIKVADLLAYEAGRKQLTHHETVAVANALGIPIYLLLE